MALLFIVYALRPCQVDALRSPIESYATTLTPASGRLLRRPRRPAQDGAEPCSCRTVGVARPGHALPGGTMQQASQAQAGRAGPSLPIRPPSFRFPHPDQGCIL